MLLELTLAGPFPDIEALKRPGLALVFGSNLGSGQEIGATIKTVGPNNHYAMTLILTATCKNGVAICADKRRTLKSDSGVRYIDDLDKVFHFPRLGCVAFNHGINRICGVSWDQYLREFEAKHLGDEVQFDFVVDRFRDFMSPTVQAEFNRNRFDDCVGYVFAAWVASGRPMVRELFWKRGCVLEDKKLSGLIRSGNGKRYLDGFLSQNPEVNRTDYWLSMDAHEGVRVLQRLASIAATEKHQAGGNEFSDDFTCGILNGQQAGTGQPATRPGPDSEGIDKPPPEAEGRSR